MLYGLILVYGAYISRDFWVEIGVFCIKSIIGFITGISCCKYDGS